MIRTKTFHSIIALISIIIIVLGAVNWMYQPSKVITWAVGMLAMPCIWLLVFWMLHKRPLSKYGPGEREFFIFSVFSSGVIMVLAMLMRLVGSTLDVSLSGIERLWGIALGLLLIGMGNIVPKILSPLSAKRCSGAEHQATQRFSGWMFVMAGIIQTLSFIFLPILKAKQQTLFVIVTALILVGLRYLWAMSRRSDTR